MSTLTEIADRIPTPEPEQVTTVNPVVLESPGRPLPLDLRVSAPSAGSGLPVVVLSHGGGASTYLPSKDGYGPLVDFWASHGFAVIQPTHLSAKAGGLGLDPSAPGHPIFWRSRVDDLTQIIDRLDEIESMSPGLRGRLDHDRIAVAGHSGGSHTAAVLLGARLAGIDVGGSDLRDPRVGAGVLLGAIGGGGDNLTEPVRQRFPEMNIDYSSLTTRTLVAYGDADSSPALTTRGPDWHADAYHDSSGAEALLTLKGGRHFLGGILGYDVRETDDEDPERLAVTQRMTWAYLWSALSGDSTAWDAACRGLTAHASSLATITTKA